MELKIYLQYMRRGWWIIVLTTLIAINVAVLVIYFIQPIYEASARFIISPNEQLTITQKEMVDTLGALDSLIVTTYSEVLSSPTIYGQTVNSLGLSPIQAEDYEINVVVLPDTNILEITVTGPDPETTADIANSNGAFAIAYMNRVYQAYKISFLDAAKIPIKTIRPRPLRDIGLSIGLGVIVGMILAILREQLQVTIDTIRSRSRFDSLSGALTKPIFLRDLQVSLAKNPMNPLSMILIKLHGLDDIIELMPRSVEQRIMQQVTKILREQLRGNDIIGRWDRTGFVVSLPNTNGKLAQTLFNRVYEHLNISVRAVEEDEDLTIQLDPHIGITTCNGNEPIQDVINRAEDAVAQAFTSDSKIVLVNLAPFV
jgi:diguanylate cyclase (GGDEF)-like protein